MIISENKNAKIIEFKDLMARTDDILNHDAQRRPQYYKTRGGNPLEDDVLEALVEAAVGTPFQHTIMKVSGQKFPDLLVNDYYGVEVKSTKEDHWKSTGSSILESTRVSSVEHIYMTFGKLGGVPAFLSKPYEECLSGIAVTHMPRYLINMELSEEDTIFAKMGIDYDRLRKMDNPVGPVARYYRSKLEPGESLWWAGDSSDESVSATIRLWRKIPTEEKRRYTAYGCVNFPEVFGGNYDQYALWLASQGIVDSHIRDQFSAGGQEEMKLSNGDIVKVPAVYRRVKAYKDLIQQLLYGLDSDIHWTEYHDRVFDWCVQVSRSSPVDFDISMDALQTLLIGYVRGK